jgi:hypothetical protein
MGLDVSIDTDNHDDAAIARFDVSPGLGDSIAQA